MTFDIYFYQYKQEAPDIKVILPIFRCKKYLPIFSKISSVTNATFSALFAKLSFLKIFALPSLSASPVLTQISL